MTTTQAPGTDRGAELAGQRRDTSQRRPARQWVVLTCGVLVFVVLCLIAARWQWNRYVDREAQIARISANYTAAPEPLDRFMGSAGTVSRMSEWRPALLHGHYLPAATVLLRNRPVGGQAGFHVLVPFVVNGLNSDEQTIMVVDRGFVPLGSDAQSASHIPVPPRGEVTATVTIRPDEPPSSRDAPAGQVHAISTPQVLAAGTAAAGTESATGDAIKSRAASPLGVYGQLRSENPPPDEQPAALPQPGTDPGSHLSYAAQWCVFALGALGGLVLLVRRDRRDRLGIDATLTAGDLVARSPTAGVRARRADRPHRATDEEAEDALISAQLDGP